MSEPLPARTTPSIAFDRTMAEVNARCSHLTILLDVGDLDGVEHVARSAVDIWLAGSAAYRRLVKQDDEVPLAEVKATRQRLDAMYLKLLGLMKRACGRLSRHPSRHTIDDLRMQLVAAAGGSSEGSGPFRSNRYHRK